MQTFIMLTRLIGEQIHPSFSLEKLSHDINEKIKKTCPEVKWISNFAILGPYDYLDIFQASNVDEAIKVASIVRSFGHASTEIWSAIEWDKYTSIAKEIERLK